MSAAPRYTRLPSAHLIVLGAHCLDCGCVVVDRDAHTRFHAILGSHAWALAVLKTAHLAAHTHDKYEVAERIDSKIFDNWSAEAFEEVTGAVSSTEDQE